MIQQSNNFWKDMDGLIQQILNYLSKEKRTGMWENIVQVLKECMIIIVLEIGARKKMPFRDHDGI